MKEIHDYECDTLCKAVKKYGYGATVVSKKLAEIGTMRPYWTMIDKNTVLFLHAYRYAYRRVCCQLVKEHKCERAMRELLDAVCAVVKEKYGDLRRPLEWECVLLELQNVHKRVKELIAEDKRKQAKIKREDAKKEGDAK